MTISIIIPAYNEASIIEGTLNSLLADKELVDCEIIVVCNGCSDNSFDVLLAYSKFNAECLIEKNIKLIALDEKKSSKTHALNVGIATSTFTTKVLLDADIKVTGLCINTLVAELNRLGLKALSPRVQFDTSKSDYLVKRYYQVEQNSKYNKTLRLSNVIALSDEGSVSLGQFPEVIADDEYLRRQFSFEDYGVLPSESFVFYAPEDLSNLVNVLSRVERGNMQLNQLGIVAKEHTRGQLLSVKFIDRVVFISVKLIAKALAYFQYNFGDKTKWQRDLSTRK